MLVGDLFFAHLTSEDGYTDDRTIEYHCNAVIGNKPSQLLVGRLKLQVLTNQVKRQPYMAYPAFPQEKKVTCIDGEKCTLTCIYGGR